MEKEEFITLIKRYQEGRASEEEKSRIDSWFESTTRDDLNPFIDQEDETRVKGQIKENILQKITQPRVRRISRGTYRWVAAVAALLVLVSTFSIQNLGLSESWLAVFDRESSWTLEGTSPGVSQVITMEEGTKMWLSGNTKIKYKSHDFKTDRQIRVEQGEVFFDVHRDSVHPFTIDVGDLAINVLGTSFNVERSDLSKIVTVQVKTGLVKVKHLEHGQEYFLKPGDGLRYHASTGAFDVHHAAISHMDLWTKGGLYLQGASFEELQQVLHDRYDVRLKAEQLSTNQFTYSLLVPQVDSIDQLLQIISSIHNLKYRRIKNEIILYQ